MAGAGYKLFNTGDVLTAAQVNTYLMQQTVMVFADASARTTALSGVLAEGMISYLQDTNSTEVYNGSAWVAISATTPKVLQVLSTMKSDTFTTTSTSDVTITGLSQAITPSSASNKVLIIVSLAASVSNTDGNLACFGISGGNTATYRGDSAGSRQRTVHWVRRPGDSATVSATNMPMTLVYLDSPATTSSVTYNAIARVGSAAGTVYVNRSAVDTDTLEWGRSASTITVMEISA